MAPRTSDATPTGRDNRKAPAPAFDPTKFAQERKMKIERAEQLRAEQRARLVAMGQLPLTMTPPPQHVSIRKQASHDEGADAAESLEQLLGACSGNDCASNIGGNRFEGYRHGQSPPSASPQRPVSSRVSGPPSHIPGSKLLSPSPARLRRNAASGDRASATSAPRSRPSAPWAEDAEDDDARKGGRLRSSSDVGQATPFGAGGAHEQRPAPRGRDAIGSHPSITIGRRISNGSDDRRPPPFWVDDDSDEAPLPTKSTLQVPKEPSSTEYITSDNGSGSDSSVLDAFVSGYDVEAPRRCANDPPRKFTNTQQLQLDELSRLGSELLGAPSRRRPNQDASADAPRAAPGAGRGAVPEAWRPEAEDVDTSDGDHFRSRARDVVDRTRQRKVDDGHDLADVFQEALEVGAARHKSREEIGAKRSSLSGAGRAAMAIVRGCVDEGAAYGNSSACDEEVTRPIPMPAELTAFLKEALVDEPEPAKERAEILSSLTSPTRRRLVADRSAELQRGIFSPPRSTGAGTHLPGEVSTLMREGDASSECGGDRLLTMSGMSADLWQSQAADFHVDIAAMTQSSTDADRDWWADGPEPSWMRQLRAEQAREHAREEANEEREQRSQPGPAPAPLCERPRPGEMLPHHAGDVGFEPDGYISEEPSPQPSLSETEQDEYKSEEPSPPPYSSDPEQQPELPRWQHAAFERGADEESSGEELSGERNEGWISGLRGCSEDEASSEADPLVWKKPSTQPSKYQAPRRPPRVSGGGSGAEGFAASDAGGRRAAHALNSGAPRPATAPSPAAKCGSASGMPLAKRGGATTVIPATATSERQAEKPRDRLHKPEPKQPRERAQTHREPRAASGGGEVRPGPERRGSAVPHRSQPGSSTPLPPPRQEEKSSSSGAAAKASVAGAQAPQPEEEGGRQMFDKNTLRTNHRDMFMTALATYQLRRSKSASLGEAEEPSANFAGSGLRVYLRKRPLFEKEAQQRGDYDIATILPPGGAIIHNCLFQADLKTPYIQHHKFDFDHVFDERAESTEVYDAAARRLVEGALEGCVGTMFMFGQTGSGKTHTMSSIQQCASHDLFADACGEGPWLSVQFVELRGNRTFDLLAPSVSDGRDHNLRPELRLREQGDGSYGAEGAVDLFPTTPEELCEIMEMAQSRRATSATDANSVSSRSHAVCRIRFCHSKGQLMLVDCAGTERKKDSMYHTKERQQECAEINASLHALKECIRALTTQQRVPSHAYRASSLTKVLADAFIRADTARLAVVCTASPCATDTEHTISTLRMGSALGGRGDGHEQKQLLSDLMPKKEWLAHPKQWTPEQVCEWLANASGGQFVDMLEKIPSNFTGQMLVRLSESRCAQLCGDNARRGRSFYTLLHQEISRVQSSRKQGF
mmetsp:Transcript_173137/g.555180  ORF Transcript_173137/g.555180 Transcript_173137/m.555180 type:complete len:1387 (-) Transcript_173137:544-4704(-)